MAAWTVQWAHTPQVLGQSRLMLVSRVSLAHTIQARVGRRVSIFVLRAHIRLLLGHLVNLIACRVARGSIPGLVVEAPWKSARIVPLDDMRRVQGLRAVEMSVLLAAMDIYLDHMPSQIV